MKIITSWDDACYSDLRLAEILNKYKTQGIFFWQNNLKNPINLKRCNKFLTLDDCKNISQQFEVGAHTVNHNYLTNLSITNAEKEIIESKRIWQENLNIKISWFCYPRGRNNPAIVEIVKAHYNFARLTELQKNDKIKNELLIKPNLHVGVERKDYEQLDWYEYGCKLFEKMKTENCKTFHIFGHSWELDEYNQWQKFEDFLKFIKDSI